MEPGSSQRELVTSDLPLRSDVGNGELAPVSLEMRAGQETFRPANPLVKTVIERDFDEGIAFPAQGFGIRLSGAGSSDPLIEVDDKVFVGNLGEEGRCATRRRQLRWRPLPQELR